MDCTPKCRLAKHAELILSAITKEDSSTVRAILPRICQNAALVSDRFGRNALHLAASCGKADVLEWLVKEYALDLESKDLESGWTCLHRSLFYGHLNCAVKLLQLGSDLSCFDKEGLSALDLVRLDSPFQLATGVQAQVVNRYETDLEGELSLQIGDVIDSIHMTDVLYWTGELKDRRGHFPKCHVELLSKDHSLELFTWGSNTNFTLGHRDESTRHVPEILESVEGAGKVSIKEVVMCKFHSVFLSVDGSVFTCGHGRGGRLGHGDEKTVLVLQEVTALQGIKCISIAAGQDHTVVVVNDGTVFTFGLNDSHQLGHSPPPTQCLLPRMVQTKAWKTKCILGAAAGRYHSVFFTRNEVFSCGLNAGQLGHSKGEKYQILPRQVSGLAHKDVNITMVTCSDGATVCATDKGDIFLLNQFMCRKIITRFVELTRLAVIGGQLDMLSSQEVGKKFADELTVMLLNSRGMVFQWKPQFNSMQNCWWCHNRPITVRDFAVGRQLLIVSDDGEAFICHAQGTKSSPSKPDSNKSTRSPSLPSSLAESQLAQSPPAPSPISQMTKDKSDANARSQPKTTPLDLLVKDGIKKENTVDFSLERIPLIHRGKRIFTDGKSRGFAVLQVASQQGLKERPEVGPGQLWQDFTQLMEEATCQDDIHDVEFLVKGKVIPAHGFILASRSPQCRQLLGENKENLPGNCENRIRTIELNDSLDQGAVVKWLRRLYGGGKINDRELFLRTIPVKDKNGFHHVKTNKVEKQLSKDRADKSSRERKAAKELGAKRMNIEHSMEDLVSLSRRDLDDFSTPVLQNEMLLESNKVPQDESPKSTSHVARKEQERAPLRSISTDKSVKFSRLNCPELFDVVVVAEGGVEFHCHKCVLIARLEYFRSMLACGWLEASREYKTLTLAVPPNVLQIVLDFLYSDQAPSVEGLTDLELLGNVLVVADQLLIGRLREICEAAMAKLITLKNVPELLEFSLLYNAYQLQDVCTGFVCNNLCSLLEAGSFNVLSDEALTKISKGYRESIPGMAWRMISPQDLHVSVLLEETEPSSAKRRKSAGRKKSSKSECEPEVLPETGNDEQGVRRDDRLIIEDDEEVFSDQQLNTSDGERVTKEKNSETFEKDDPPPNTNEQTPGKQQDILSKTQDPGTWYRKHSAENSSSQKSSRNKKSAVVKTSVDSPSNTEQTSDKASNITEKVAPCEEPAWSNTSSVSSPPAASLKAIIEQEESRASRGSNPVKEKSPSKMTSKILSRDQRASTSPQGAAVRWSAGGRQSQKQRKRSKSNTQEDASDSSKESEGKSTTLKQAERHVEQRRAAWGGIGKEPSPVKSLRDLMQEEEQMQTDQSEDTPSSGLLSASGKSGSARKKLNWLPQRDFYANCSDAEAIEATDHRENLADVPLSPKRAWQSNPVASSPPSSSLTFSEILESQEQENTTLDRVSRKPFHLTQLEERAMEELLDYYGGRYNPCESVTVQRIQTSTARPLWRKERSQSTAST